MSKAEASTFLLIVSIIFFFLKTGVIEDRSISKDIFSSLVTIVEGETFTPLQPQPKLVCLIKVFKVEVI